MPPTTYSMPSALPWGGSRTGARVIQTATGGGFGGKEEFPSGLAIHTALLGHEGWPAREAGL